MLYNPAAEAEHKRKRFKAPTSPASTWTPPTAAHGWHIFPLQEQAFAFADNEARERKQSCWAEELDASGRRRYVVASLRDFWRRYRKLRCDNTQVQRHFYEIIRDRKPCHLHLDIEFATASNPECDGERMVATLRQELIGALVANFDIASTDCEAVDLESSCRHVKSLRGAPPLTALTSWGQLPTLPTALSTRGEPLGHR